MGEPKKVGGQLGNTNGSHDKPWQRALDKQLKDYKPGVDSTVEQYWALQEIAKKVIDMALDGEMAAIKEIGDRSDGKAVQGINLEGNLVVYQPRIKRLDGSVDEDE